MENHAIDITTEMEPNAEPGIAVYSTSGFNAPGQEMETSTVQKGARNKTIHSPL
jgi:hypothetical protein